MTELYLSSLFSSANLVSYWRFENNANDSKTSNNGTGTDITYSTANGVFNLGSGFNGSTSKIVISDAASIKPTTNFSLTTWIKTSGSASDKGIFQSYSANSNPAGFYIRTLQTSGTVRFRIGKNSGTTANVDYKDLLSLTDICDDSWHFLCCVWDGTNMYIYIDSKIDNQTAWSNAPSYAATNYPRIGTQNNSGTELVPMTGSFDDMALWSKALSQSEINSLYLTLGGSFLLNFV